MPIAADPDLRAALPLWAAVFAVSVACVAYVLVRQRRRHRLTRAGEALISGRLGQFSRAAREIADCLRQRQPGHEPPEYDPYPDGPAPPPRHVPGSPVVDVSGQRPASSGVRPPG